MSEEKQKTLFDWNVPRFLFFLETIPVGRLILLALSLPFVVVAYRDPGAFCELVKFLLANVYLQVFGLVVLGCFAVIFMSYINASKKRIHEMAERKREAEEVALGNKRPSLDMDSGMAEEEEDV